MAWYLNNVNMRDTLLVIQYDSQSCGVQLVHVRKKSLDSEAVHIKKSIFTEEIEKAKENLPFFNSKNQTDLGSCCTATTGLGPKKYGNTSSSVISLINTLISKNANNTKSNNTENFQGSQ